MYIIQTLIYYQREQFSTLTMVVTTRWVDHTCMPCVHQRELLSTLTVLVTTRLVDLTIHYLLFITSLIRVISRLLMIFMNLTFVRMKNIIKYIFFSENQNYYAFRKWNHTYFTYVKEYVSKIYFFKKRYHKINYLWFLYVSTS